MKYFWNTVSQSFQFFKEDFVKSYSTQNKNKVARWIAIKKSPKEGIHSFLQYPKPFAWYWRKTKCWIALHPYRFIPVDNQFFEPSTASDDSYLFKGPLLPSNGLYFCIFHYQRKIPRRGFYSVRAFLIESLHFSKNLLLFHLQILHISSTNQGKYSNSSGLKIQRLYYYTIRVMQ